MMKRESTIEAITERFVYEKQKNPSGNDNESRNKHGRKNKRQIQIKKQSQRVYVYLWKDEISIGTREKQWYCCVFLCHHSMDNV